MEQRSKQRLIGAVVLVALGVIFLPMLLSGPVEQTRVDIDLDMPSAPEVPPQPELPSAESMTTPEPGAALADHARPDPEALITEEAPAPIEEPPAGESREAADPSVPAGEVSDSVFVQVGAFQSRENAQRLVDELRGDDFPARLVEAEDQQGPSHRVQAGPFPDRPAAETAAQALADQHGLAGFIIEP